MSLVEENHRAVIGGNNPPTPIESARVAFLALSDFLKAHPAIMNHEEAKDAKAMLDMAKATEGDLDAARKAEGDPLYSAWKAVNEKYKPAINALSRIAGDLKARLTDFIRAEEARRAREAAEARRIAEEAAAAANAALAAEREARENAALGEINAPLGEAIEATDDAIAAAKRTDREAAVAERDADHVRIGGGFGRVASLRQKETLVVTDAAKAIKSIGLTDKIRDAILSSARDYRKLKGELPKGVTAEYERTL